MFQQSQNYIIIVEARSLKWPVFYQFLTVSLIIIFGWVEVICGKSIDSNQLTFLKQKTPHIENKMHINLILNGSPVGSRESGVWVCVCVVDY